MSYGYYIENERYRKGGIAMDINSISLNKVSHNVTSVAISPIDTETKNIMNQITNRQQSLNRLSSDSEMPAEEKAKERQEIQKQIAELNRKLRMLRMEKKEEAEEIEKEQKQKTASEENAKEKVSQVEAEKISLVTDTEKQQGKNTVSPQNIKKILESGSVLQKERIQQKVEQKEEAIQNVLEAEIKADELYGTDSTVKKEKLRVLIESKKNGFEIEEQQERRSRSSQKNSVKIVFRDDEI